MKKILLFMMLLTSIGASAQMDTLFLKDGKEVICRVREMDSEEVKILYQSVFTQIDVDKIDRIHTSEGEVIDLKAFEYFNEVNEEFVSDELEEAGVLIEEAGTKRNHAMIASVSGIGAGLLIGLASPPLGAAFIIAGSVVWIVLTIQANNNEKKAGKIIQRHARKAKRMSKKV